MRRGARWSVCAIVAVHGLIHLLGAVKGFGWADVDTLTEPIGTLGAVGWLAAAVLVVTAACLFAASRRWWWLVGAAGAVVSQIMIIGAWRDAKAGTAANVVLGVSVLHGFASQGPFGFRSEYRRLTAGTLAAVAASQPDGSNAVTESDLGGLPAPLAAYVAWSGAVGQPHVGGFRARISGRIRSGPDKPWMPFTGEQVNTYLPEPSRVFFMDATMFGLPVDVLHAYVGDAAQMRVRLCSIGSMISSAGAEVTRAETVTLLNDLCVMAPAALVDAPVRWTALDDHHVRAEFTNAGHTVTAELEFNDRHELVDFVSDDRLRASANGQTFTRQRWSTPLREHRDVGSRRVAVLGLCRWHGAQPEHSFDYLEFHVDDITYFDLPITSGASSTRPSVLARQR
jgi:hypothetical protein